jgi:DNA-binding LacI/PurR family transcriptional regulator
VEFEYEKLGDRAAELLLKIIAEPRKTHSVEPLPTDLVVGSTTGDVRETHRAPGAVPKQSR